MSAVLGQAIELAITSGYVVAARGAAPPGVEDLVGMAAGGARRVDAAGVLRAESLGLRLVGRDGLGEGNADGANRGERQERPEDSPSHPGLSVTQTAKMRIPERPCLRVFRAWIV